MTAGVPVPLLMKERTLIVLGATSVVVPKEGDGFAVARTGEWLFIPTSGSTYTLKLRVTVSSVTASVAVTETTAVPVEPLGEESRNTPS